MFCHCSLLLSGKSSMLNLFCWSICKYIYYGRGTLLSNMERCVGVLLWWCACVKNIYLFLATFVLRILLRRGPSSTFLSCGCVEDPAVSHDSVSIIHSFYFGLPLYTCTAYHPRFSSLAYFIIPPINSCRSVCHEVAPATSLSTNQL